MFSPTSRLIILYPGFHSSGSPLALICARFFPSAILADMGVCVSIPVILFKSSTVEIGLPELFRAPSGSSRDLAVFLLDLRRCHHSLIHKQTPLKEIVAIEHFRLCE